MRNFPRTRHAAPPGECHRSVAVAKYLAACNRAEPRPAPEGARGRKGKAAGKWRGRPGQAAPGLVHSPSAARPAAPPLREAGAQSDDLTPWTARRSSAGRREHARVHPARPRPSRVLAELVADATP